MNLDLSKINSVHFIGIGGIGVSAIARMMLSFGKKVTGQNTEDSKIITDLKNLGALIKIGQSFENIPEDTDLIVYTIAIDTFDKELAEKIKNLAKGEQAKKILVKSYPEMLGIISEDKNTIAVCGTHGKTTTTAMISQILRDNKKDPTVIVGSLLAGDNSNFIKGDSDILVVEACEYRRSFLNINPKIIVITNIDEDHLDYYKDIEDIKNAFREFIAKVPEDGFVICDTTDVNVKDVIKDIKVKVIDYNSFFDLGMKLKIPGVHNKKNGAAALAVSSIFGIEKEKSLDSLSEFKGTWRRFEYKGELSNGLKIYDDYAHHPREISATLSGFREFFPKKDGYNITVVFQPHLFSRTKLLLGDFSKSFNDADKVILLPIYYAREEDDGSISSFILAEEINKEENTTKATAFNSFKEVEEEIAKVVFTNKDILVTMGAGEAFKILEKLF